MGWFDFFFIILFKLFLYVVILSFANVLLLFKEISAPSPPSSSSSSSSTTDNNHIKPPPTTTPPAHISSGLSQLPFVPSFLMCYPDYHQCPSDIFFLTDPRRCGNIHSEPSGADQNLLTSWASVVKALNLDLRNNPATSTTVTTTTSPLRRWVV